MAYGRRYLKRSGKVAKAALARRRVRRAAKVAIIAALAGRGRARDAERGAERTDAERDDAR